MHSAPLPAAPLSPAEIEELQSRPTDGVLRVLSRHPGAVAVLGAGGRLGPSLALMLRRGLDALGRRDPVYAISRFTTAGLRERLAASGIQPVICDLLEHDALRLLPEAAAVFHLIGLRHSPTADPGRLWALHTLAPTHAVKRYSHSRIVMASDGRVYPARPLTDGGAPEETPLAVADESDAACVARERLVTFTAQIRQTPILFVRLEPVAALRHGCLVETALRVLKGVAVDVAHPPCRPLWIGDALAWLIQCLDLANHPPAALNLAGDELLDLRAAAARFGSLLGRTPVLTGEVPTGAQSGSPARALAHFGPPLVRTQTVLEWIANSVRSPLFCCDPRSGNG